MLVDIGIIQKQNSSTENIFSRLTPNFLKEQAPSSSAYVAKLWAEYKRISPNLGTEASLNGKIFEVILATACIREGLLPLFLSSKVAFVPNIIYDLMFYSQEIGPICLSAKTSLRERYKQADLEAIALKYVHRKSQSYLVTLDEGEAKSVKEKIRTGSIIGLDEVIVATSPEFDILLQKIRGYRLAESPEIKVVTSNQIITQKNIQSYL